MFEFIYQLHDAFSQAGATDPLKETLHLCDILTNGALRGLDGRSLLQNLTLDELIAQRQQGIPLEYILQQAVFMGRPFTCTPDTLIPRAETELLVRTVLTYAAKFKKESLTIVDVGTGSGNIAISLALELPHSHVFALDISPEAAVCAQRHVDEYALPARVSVRCGDMFAPIADEGLEQAVDIVVCNPPYIPSGSLSKLAAEIIDHEPLVALDAGPYGLNIFRRLVQEAQIFLRPGGLLAFEFGVGQETLVRRLVQKNGGYAQLPTVSDSNGNPRVLVAKKIS